MMQWFLSSSILILMIMALRWLLKGRISLRLQYALWALVLVRLLVPMSLPASRISVQNIAVSAPVREAAQVRLPQQSFDDAYAQVVQEYRDQGVAVESIDQSTLDTQAMERMKSEITLGQALAAIWALGVAAVLGFTAWCNVRFRARLRRSWRRLELPWVSLPVYVSPELDTPCIFGSFRPVICLTPDVAEDETLLRHILEHELTHHRHGDHVLAPLRCVALALHWFNPLVWLAVGQSRRDGEMACDEGTIRRLGEGERISYGRTLIRLTCQTSRPRDYVLAATTLRSDKMTIKERIVMIAKKPTTALYALLIVVCITAFAIGCTFTGAQESENHETTETAPTQTEATEPTQARQSQGDGPVTWTLEAGVLTVDLGGAHGVHRSDLPLERPEDITEIRIKGFAQIMDTGMFAGLPNLTRVTIGEGFASSYGELFADCTSLERVVFESPDAFVGYGMFQGCTSLREVTLSDNAPEISAYAFQDCVNLTTIHIPDSVTSIGDGAFQGCTKLERVSIGQGLRDLGGMAFAGCAALREITLPESLQQIGTQAFDGCASLERFNVTGDEGHYTVDDNGILYDKANGVLLRVPPMMTGELVVDGSVTSIESGAFEGTHLTKVVLPAIVKYVGFNAFSNSRTLAELVINSDDLQLGATPFANCTMLTRLVLPEGVDGLPTGLTDGCVNLQELYLPASLIWMDEGAMDNCPENLRIFYAGTEAQWKSIAVYSDNEELPGIPVEFEAPLPATSAPAPIVAAPSAGQREITWNLSGGLLTVSGQGELTDEISEHWEAQAEKINEIQVEEGITSLGYRVFAGLPNLKTVHIPTSVKNIESDFMINSANVTSIQVAPGNTRYASDDQGALYDSTMTVLVQAPKGFTGTFRVPDTVTTIDELAFHGAKLKRITLPDGLTSIGYGAFQSCVNLESIDLSMKLNYLGDETFKGCTGLRECTISNYSISTFDECTGLERVYITRDMVFLPRNPFDDSVNLRAIVVEEGHERYYSDAQGALYSRATRNGVQTIELRQVPAALTGTFHVPEGVGVISGRAFSHCRISEVVLPDSVTVIEMGAFANCGNLKILRIPDTVTELGERIIENSAVEALRLPDGLTELYSNVLEDASNLRRVYIPDTVQAIGSAIQERDLMLTDVYYGGTKEAWQALGLNRLSATVHYEADDLP